MADSKNPLSLYEEGIEKGIADVGEKLKNDTLGKIKDIEKEIENLGDAVDKYNLAIKNLQTQKTTAAKNEKKILNSKIAADREEIAAIKQQISEKKELLKNTKQFEKEIKESYDLISDGVYSYLKTISDRNNAESLAFKLWYGNGDERTDDDVAQKSISYLAGQKEIQAEGILNLNKAYEEAERLYGENYDGCVKLKNELYELCIAYEKTSSAIDSLKGKQSYSTDEAKDIIFALSDYLKESYKKLSEAGFKDETIYAVARKATGYEDLYQSNFIKEESRSEAVAGADMLCDELSKTFGEIPEKFTAGMERSIEEIAASLSAVFASAAQDKIPQPVQAQSQSSVSSNTFNSTYNLTYGSRETIADQLSRIKNFEIIKRARNL